MRSTRLLVAHPGLGIGVVPLLLALTLAGCELPEAPTWDVDLNVPITNRVDTLADIIDGEDGLGIGADGTIQVTMDEPIDPIGVDSEVAVSPFSESDSIQLGVIEVTAPSDVQHSFLFAQLWPPALLVDGSMQTVEPFTFDVVSGPLSLDTFVNATFAQGRAQLDLTNNLAVAIGPATVSIRNAGSGTVVGTAFLSTPLAPGASTTRIVDFSGQTLENTLVTRVQGDGQGSTGPVLIDAQATLDMDVRFLSPLTVTQAVTTVPLQTIVRTETIQIGGALADGEVVFSNGLIELGLDNQSELNAQVTVSLPEFGGAAASVGQTANMNPLSGANVAIDVGGETWQPQTPGEVVYEVSMTVWSNGPVLVSSTDELASAVEMREAAQIESFAGVLDATTVDIPSTTSAVDMPDGLDQVSFTHATISIELDNAVDFPVDLSGTLVGRNDAGEMVTVLVNDRLAAGTPAGPVRTTITLDETNSNIVELMDIAPSSFEFGGHASVGDGVTSGRLDSGDTIVGSVTLIAPLAVELGADRISGDPEELDIDSDTRDRIRDDVSAGTVTAQVRNGLPTGATVHLIVSRTMAGAGDPDAPGNLVLSGSVDSLGRNPDGTASGSHDSLLQFELDKTDLAIFESGPTYTGVVLDIPGSNGETVRFLATDSIAVQAVATLTTRVEFD